MHIELYIKTIFGKLEEKNGKNRKLLNRHTELIPEENMYSRKEMRIFERKISQLRGNITS